MRPRIQKWAAVAGVLLIAILPPVFAIASEAGASPGPNILFIMADDLGIRDLGCYGSDYYRTPNLDRFAQQGMKFTRAYAGSHVCSPTRASIFTGLYPHRVHITDALPWDRLPENPKLVPPDYLKELPAELPTFPKALRAAGYRTALCGKWHLGNEYRLFEQDGCIAYGFDEAFDSFHPEIARDKAVDVLTEHALGFLEENKNRPFMLCLFHHTPHVPLACPAEDEALYDGVPKGHFQKNQKYAGMISRLDRSVQTVLDKLSELGLDKNTVVIFTSDNGGFSGVTSNEPFRGGKGNLFEGGIRVPLLVRWPGRIAPGSVCDAPVHSADYFPTFLALVGLPPMPEARLDGVSMLPLWRGGRPAVRTLYWHKPHYHVMPQSVMMEGDWKLVHDIESNTYALFDLKADPEEKNDRVAACPERVARMAKMLEEHLQQSGAQRMRPNPDWDPAKPAGNLRNFGVYYPINGTIYQQVKDPYPSWFKPGR